MRWTESSRRAAIASAASVKVGPGVWQLKVGQQIVLSSLFQSTENVSEPAQILLGITSFGPESERVQTDWPDGTLAEYALLSAASVVPVDGFDGVDAVRLTGVSRFLIPYGGLARGRLDAGETLIANGATGAYGRIKLRFDRQLKVGHYPNAIGLADIVHRRH